jgi:hypothetical protein
MNVALTGEKLRQLAPSIFAKHERPGLTEKYNFIPTVQLVKVLFNEGWIPVQAQEMRVRDDRLEGYQKHMIRFRNFTEKVQDKLIVGDTFVEMVLTNSHNGLASFIFNLGLFRLACSNGMVVSEGTFNSAIIRHNSYDAKNVIEICQNVVKTAPVILTDIQKMKAIDLEPSERVAFGNAAKELRFADPESIDTDYIIEPRRTSDRKTDLWTTYNVVQENLIKGKLPYDNVNKNGVYKRKHTKEVKAIDGSIKLNQALWTLTQQMAKIKTGEIVLGNE